MKKLLLLTKTLLAAALLCVGQNAWAADVYTIVYGTPTYTDAVITGVTPQTDFTSDDGNTASDVTSSDANGDNCTNAMPIGGSVLYSSANFSKSFASPATKCIVHFEANYTATTNGQETWQILDSKGVEIFGTTDAGYSNGNATKIWGFCNGVSLGTNWFRNARTAHNRVVLDINFSTRKVSYTVLVSSGSNSYSTLTGTYDLPAAVNDVATFKANKQTYYSYMDNVSFYNVYDDAVTEYSYTVNYKLGDDVVKISSGSAAVDVVITAETAINGSEEGFVGNHYLITAGSAPTMTITSGTNVLDVPVRAPYTATLNVTKTIGGVAQTPVVTNLVETDAKVCSWNYTYPMYVQKDGVYYVADVTSSFGESGTFTDGETINKTVAYTTPDYSVVYFGEPNEVTGTNTAYSNGATGFIKGGVTYDDDRVIRLGQLAAGTYRLITNITGDAARNLVVGDYTAGTASFPTALVTITTTGAKDESFTVDGTQLISISGKDQGSGKFNQSATLDYVLVKASSVSATIGATGWATFSSDYALDFTGISDFEAYMITDHDGTVVTKSQVTGTVPAGTGLLLKGDEDSYNIPVVASSSTDVSANKLVAGTGESVSKEDNMTKYVLGVSGSDEAEFQKIDGTAATVAKGKAYLVFNGEILARTMSFVGDITGVETVEAAAEAKAKEGKFIENGKLVIVKNGQKFNAAGAKLY